MLYDWLLLIQTEFRYSLLEKAFPDDRTKLQAAAELRVLCRVFSPM